MLLQYADACLQDGKPYNNQFEDIYYQREDGIAESEHVFIRGNDLRARFAALSAPFFTVAEIGFGSGLNFLHCADVFLQTAPASAHLHFVSFEYYPLRREVLAQLLTASPRAEIGAALLRDYPDNHAGHHLLKLHARISLHLIFGDVRETLPQLRARADAWFLDGFAPQKNPLCWSQEVLAEVGAHSHADTTLSTFSAARLVRDRLTAAGFAVEKCRGFGRKRDMIRAKMTHPLAEKATWLNQPSAPTGKIAIVGAGIAAMTTARALAESGRQVTIFHDPDSPPASAVPLAVPYLQPDRRDTPARRFQLCAWLHAIRALNWLRRENRALFLPCGVARIASNDQEKTRHQDLLNAKLLNETTLFGDENGHLHYPAGGAIALPETLAHLRAHERISQRAEKITSLDQLSDFAAIILCAGWQNDLNPEPLLARAIRPLRGQGTIFHSPSPLTRVICDQNTFIPCAHSDQPYKIYSGATFSPNNSDLTPRAEDDAKNAAMLAHFLGQTPDFLEKISHFVGIRAAARDYLPLLGAVAKSESVAKVYRAYRYNARAQVTGNIDFHSGVYQFQGLGSKGCSWAWLGADVLCALINGSPVPIAADQLAALSPTRFLIRGLKRNQLIA